DNALPEVFGEGSKTTFDELDEMVRRSDTIVLPIYLDTERESNRHGTPPAAYAIAREQLALLASESGNQVYQARKLKDLKGVYQQVIRDLSTVYSIGYRPATRKHDGVWHAVTVQLPGRDDFGVRARRGYFESRFSKATPTMRGYRFSMSASAGEFSINADPIDSANGRHFYTDSNDEAIHVNPTAGASRSDPTL